MIPGRFFGPELQPLRVKGTRAPREKKYFFWGGEQSLKKRFSAKSSAKSERARKVRMEERERKMREKQKECAAKQKECAARRKEEERLREEARGDAEVEEAASFDERPISKPKNGRNEAALVDSTILKILGRTPKSKVTPKGIVKREVPKVVAPAKKSVPILRKIIHEKMQERKKKPKLPATKPLEMKRPVQQNSQLTESAANLGKTAEEGQPKADVCQVVPCVDLGPNSGTGDEVEDEVKIIESKFIQKTST